MNEVAAELMKDVLDAYAQRDAERASEVWTGDPNGSGLPSWPSYRGAEAPVMALDTSAAAAPEEGRAPHALLESVVTERRKAERLVIPSGGHMPQRAKE